MESFYFYYGEPSSNDDERDARCDRTTLIFNFRRSRRRKSFHSTSSSIDRQSTQRTKRPVLVQPTIHPSVCPLELSKEGTEPPLPFYPNSISLHNKERKKGHSKGRIFSSLFEPELGQESKLSSKSTYNRLLLVISATLTNPIHPVCWICEFGRPRREEELFRIDFHSLK